MGNFLTTIQDHFWRRIRPTDPSFLLQINSQNGQRPLHAVVGGSNGSESLFVCRAPGGGREASRPGQLDGQGCLTVIPDGMGPQIVQVYQVCIQNVWL